MPDRAPNGLEAHSGDRRQGGCEEREEALTKGMQEERIAEHSELGLLVEQVVWPLAEDFAPDALVLQCGADGLRDDPQSKLCLSNRALWRLVGQAGGFAQRLLVLGGGDYNPWAVARCWTGIWASLNALDLPDRLPPEAEAVLRAITWRLDGDATCRKAGSSASPTGLTTA